MLQHFHFIKLRDSTLYYREGINVLWLFLFLANEKETSSAATLLDKISHGNCID